jgi:hypothetical protein
MTARWVDLPPDDWLGLMRGLRRVMADLESQGAWENPRRMGTAYLWVDATGVLRVNTAKPTSDTDGTIVGTQT